MTNTFLPASTRVHYTRGWGENVNRGKSQNDRENLPIFVREFSYDKMTQLFGGSLVLNISLVNSTPSVSPLTAATQACPSWGRRFSIALASYCFGSHSRTQLYVVQPLSQFPHIYNRLLSCGHNRTLANLDGLPADIAVRIRIGFSREHFHKVLPLFNCPVSPREILLDRFR